MTTIKSSDGVRVYKGMENQYQDGKDILNQIDQRRDEIKNDPNMSADEKKMALKQCDAAEKQVRMALDFATNSAKWDTNDGSTVGDNNIDAVLARLDAAMAALDKVDTIIGTSAANTTTSVGEPGSTGGTGSTDKSADAKAAAQEDAYQANFAGKEPSELADMASKDPKQFYENMRGVSSEDRQMLMQMMNQHLQDMNQMFSMMSNLSKAQHDTAKALINNMRV